MATPKPGEIRCPTCHRSTPPAAFCTQCGSAIPPDARTRPRGMDRDELQERIRARRTRGEPYRRGGAVDDERAGYERFEPDPEDARARRGGGSAERRPDHFEERPVEEAPPRPDLTRDRDEWARPAAVPTPAAIPPPAEPYAPPPSDVVVGDEPQPEYVDNFDDAAYADAEYPYEYDEWDDTRGRRSGGGALAILGFLALGVLALLGGAALAGVFSGPSTGELPSTPSPSASIAATVEPSASLFPSGTGGPSASPGASGGPVVFPDGFSAEAQPCIPGSASVDGCNSNAAVNSGQVEIWVGFTNGSGDDVLGVRLVLPDGSTEDGSIELADINCGATCNGYTYFPFGGLTPGTYHVEITRNGEPAGSTSFEVT